MAIIDSPETYFPFLENGVYKDTFENFYSHPGGMTCKCSKRKTVFKNVTRFKQHCRGKIHQKYLDALLTIENNPLRKLFEAMELLKTLRCYITSLERDKSKLERTNQELRDQIPQEVPSEDLLGIN